MGSHSFDDNYGARTAGDFVISDTRTSWATYVGGRQDRQLR